MTKKYRAMKFGKPYKLYIMPSARRKINRRCGIFLAVVSVIYVVCAAAAGFNSVIEKMSVKFLEANAARIINTAISDSLVRDFDYSKLVNITYSPQGEIASVSADTGEMNRLKATLTLDILNAIERSGEKSYSVPLGNLTEIILFSGIGPDICFNILPYGAATVDFRNGFTSAGVNQTLHEVYIDITADLYAVSPVSKVCATVTTSVMAARTVIVGEVPHLFAGDMR